jgi:hypothetical protein
MISKLSIDKNDSLLAGQASIIEGILAVRKLNSVSAAAETTIYDHLQQIAAFNHPALRKENAVRYMLSRLSLVYAKDNNLVKKELAYPKGQSYYTTTGNAQDMIDFMNRKDHSPLIKYMISKYPVSLVELHKIKAALYMYEYNFQAAVLEFEKATTGGITDLSANPFTIHIVDCHDCDYAAKKTTGYSKYSFAKKMLELKAKGDAGPDKESRAQNYFLYANGMYNMTWYGNSRELFATKVANVDYNTVVYGKSEQFRTGNFFNCKDALLYYQKAFTLSKNKEFRAKCAWMSAKCEYYLWLDNGEEDRKSDFIAGKYFQQMRSEFSNTQYYKEVINECGYFCTYITRSDSCKRNR